MELELKQNFFQNGNNTGARVKSPTPSKYSGAKNGLENMGCGTSATYQLKFWSMDSATASDNREAEYRESRVQVGYGKRVSPKHA